MLLGVTSPCDGGSVWQTQLTAPALAAPIAGIVGPADVVALAREQAAKIRAVAEAAFAEREGLDGAAGQAGGKSRFKSLFGKNKAAAAAQDADEPDPT